MAVQSALYRIAATASTAEDMAAFYSTMHEIVGELMYADNFYIALYNEERQQINFPFYRDEVDTDLPDPNAWDPFGVGEGRGSTAYVLRHGRPEHWTTRDFLKLAKKGEALKEEMDSLMDEIDEVLEENAEEFVKNYVQRGGQ